jgi:hypothetical protein
MDYCLLVKKLKDEGRTMADAQKLAEKMVYGEKPVKVANTTQTHDREVGAHANAGSPSARNLLEITVSQPQAARLPAAYSGTQAKSAILASVRTRLESSTPPERPKQIQKPRQAARQTTSYGGARSNGATAAGTDPILPRSIQARAPTQVPGLFLNRVEPVVEVASLPRDPTQALKPIKIEAGMRAEASAENVGQLEAFEAADKKDFAAPPYQNSRWSSERR